MYVLMLTAPVDKFGYGPYVDDDELRASAREAMEVLDPDEHQMLSSPVNAPFDMADVGAKKLDRHASTEVVNRGLNVDAEAVAGYVISINDSANEATVGMFSTREAGQEWWAEQAVYFKPDVVTVEQIPILALRVPNQNQ